MCRQQQSQFTISTNIFSNKTENEVNEYVQAVAYKEVM